MTPIDSSYRPAFLFFIHVPVQKVTFLLRL